MDKNKKMDLLKQAWKEVFDVDDVADDADFFAEGGDSIKAVQLSAWLLQKGVKLDLGKIFYTPVLSQMAETLEETDPVYVPEQMMTKDLAKKMTQDYMSSKKSGKKMSGKPEQNVEDDQRICDPEEMAGDDQRICDPKEMARDDQRICDPEEMAGDDQRICDPEEMPAPGFARGFARRDPAMDMMVSMFQTMMQQQQVMLQMMQLMLGRMMPPPAAFQPAMPGFPGKKPPKAPGKKKSRKLDIQNLPPEVQAEIKKQMAKYRSRKVDKPIENPNVIGLEPATVTKPEHSAEEVLDHVLGGLLENGFNKTDDLFEQGLTSLDTVKLVTRCAEHGYSLSMQDIYMHSTYDGLLECMKPGK
jgi:aryl carrier-like protein